MPFLVIGGEYRIVGAQPDGDSIRFYPDDPSQWDDVGGPYKVQGNATGGAQLRLDAIDALKTHYAIPGGTVHQPLTLAHAARDELLKWLGFTGIPAQAVPPPHDVSRMSDGGTSLAGFLAYLDQQADQVYVMPDLHYTGLSTLIEVTDQTVRLTVAPELLIFEER